MVPEIPRQIRYLILLLTLISAFTPLLSGITTSASNLELVSVSLTNTAGEPRAYPGSRGVTYSVEVRVVGNETLYGLQACFKMPPQIELVGPSCVEATTPNGTYAGEFSPGDIAVFRTVINIPKSTKPGTYYADLNISYRPGSPLAAPIYEELTTEVKVSRYPTPQIVVTEAWWSPEEVFPGTEGATLYLRLVNTGDVDINKAYLKVSLDPAFHPSTLRTEIRGLASGDWLIVSVGQTSIYSTTPPRDYIANITLEAQAVTPDGVTYTATVVGNVEVRVSEPPPLPLEVIDSGWVQGAAWGTTSYLTAYVTLRVTDQVRIESLVANLTLPSGISTRDGSSTITTTMNTPVTYGDTFTLNFGPLNVTSAPAGVAELTIAALASKDGAEFWSTWSATVNLSTVSESPVRLVRTGWFYAGQPAEALPTAKGVEFRVYLMNLAHENVRGVEVLNVTAPPYMKLRNVRGCGPVSAGSTCYLSLVFDIDPDAAPGEVVLGITYSYTLGEGQAILWGTDTITAKAAITDPRDLDPAPIVTGVWWGTQPSHQEPMDRVATVTIALTNPGRYPANSLIISALLSGAAPMRTSGTCTPSLQPGASCTLTLYYDLGNVSEGDLALDISITYYLTQYGAHYAFTKRLTHTLPVEMINIPGKGGLEPVDWGWSGDPVMPGTENATLYITIANNLPYPVAGIRVTLYPMTPNLTTESGRPETAYVSGPIQTAQTFTVTYQMSAVRASPGTYPLRIDITYLIESGGPGLEGHDVWVINASVAKEGIIEYVTSGWAGKQPGPGTYGATYVVVLRNLGDWTVHSAIARLELPAGFTATADNSSIASSPATFTPSPPTTPTLQDILAALSPQQAGAQEQASKGDLLVFSFNINVFTDPGTYYGTLNISFVDGWGTVRYYSLLVPLTVLGTTNAIVVWSDTTLRFLGGEGNVTVKVRNVGEAPANSVTLFVYSTNPVVVVRRSVYYLGKIPPNEEVEITVPVYINPATQTGLPYITSFGNIPLMAYVIATDPSGSLIRLNQTFSVPVEPYTYPVLQDVKAEQVGMRVKVVGTLTNLGTAPVLSAAAYIVDEDGNVYGPSLIGDVDPASQASFSLEAHVSKVMDEVTVVINYTTPLGKVETITKVYPLTHEEVVTTTTPPPQTFAGLTTYEWVVVAFVGAFLVFTALAIRSYLRKH